MKPLRVLYIIDSLDSGGAQRQTALLLTSLDRSVIEPTLAIYYPRYHFAPELEAAGVPIVLLGEHGGRDPRVLVRLARLMRSGRFDLIHATLRTPGQLARLAGLAGGVPPLIVSELDLFLGDSYPRLWLERRLCHGARAMIVNSNDTRRHVEALVPYWRRRTHLVPNGVVLSALEVDERAAGENLRTRYRDPGTRLLGVVARIDHNKGPDRVAAALRSLPQAIAARLSVVWIGASVERNQVTLLQRLADDPTLRTRFTLVSPRQSMRPFYAAIDGLLLASRSESMPNAVLESLAQSTPVIATDVGAVRQMVIRNETGWLVPSGDAGALCDAIRDFVLTPSDRLRRMGAHGRRRISDNYSTQRLVERTLAVYDQVIGRLADQ